jgi:hypothetical protein
MVQTLPIPPEPAGAAFLLELLGTILLKQAKEVAHELDEKMRRMAVAEITPETPVGDSKELLVS